jgi:hypothetical protein
MAVVPHSASGGVIMASRAERRAAARAGRICPVCGERIDAARSTRKFCSTRCRVAAHEAKVKPLKEGLRPTQIKILSLLGTVRGKGGLNRAMIAERIGTGRGHLTDLIGQNDPRRRKAREARTGIRSLLTLDYIASSVIPGDSMDSGRAETVYLVTDKGREALAAAMTTETGKVLARRVDEIVRRLREEA